MTFLYSSLINNRENAFKLRILVSSFLRISMKNSKNLIHDKLTNTTNEEFMTILLNEHALYEPKIESIKQQIKSFTGSIKPIFKHYQLGTFDRYLDFGCGSGIITMAVKEIIQASTVHGVDIVNHLKTPITMIDINDLNDLYDFITINQVLHHVDDLTIISKLINLLKPDGYLLLKEHDCDNEDTKMLMILQHEFYRIDKNENMPVIHFNSKEYWIEQFESYGLVNQGIYINNVNDATKSFHVLFQKQ